MKIVFYRLQVEFDCFVNVRKGFLSCITLTDTSGQRWNNSRIAPLIARFQYYSEFHFPTPPSEIIATIYSLSHFSATLIISGNFGNSVYARHVEDPGSSGV